MQLNLGFFLALTLIDRVPGFRNSYQLSKVLAWKFHLIEFVDLIDKLEENKYVSSKMVDSLRNYEITDAGKAYISNFSTEGLSLLKSSYPEQIEFINLVTNDKLD
jgi:DNA-binding PadR family transcriptional regulator